VWLVLVLTALLAAARAAFVVPFSLLHNIWSADKLSSRDIVVVWWAGAQVLLVLRDSTAVSAGASL
jgi:hypothetical protein